MEEDDDYFSPAASTSSRRLAMLFGGDEMSSAVTNTSHHAEPTTHFRFVAPKQPRPGRSSSSASTSSGSGQASSRDGQEVLLEVVLGLLPQGAERSGAAKTQVTCQVVGNAVRRSFILAVVAVQDKGELWRAAVDSHLLLEVVERSTLRVTAHGKSLTLVGEAQRIETLVMQLAIYRAVCSEGPTQQDLCVGKGCVLGEGDVAKVCCTTYTITSTALRGEKVDDLKGVKVTVSPAAGGGWESCLAGAVVDSRRLIFFPKSKEGKWLPPATYHDVTVMKVRIKGTKDKAPPPTAAAASPASPPAVTNINSSTKQHQQQQQTVTSHDASAAPSPQNSTSQNGDVCEAQEHDTQEEEDRAARKAALVSRMAQVGTALFPPMPSAKVVPQPSEVTAQAAVESKEAQAEGEPVPASTLPPPPNPVSTTSSATLPSTTTTTTPASTTVTTSTPSHNSTPTSVLTSTTTTTPVPVPTLAVPHPQAPSLALDSTLALTICHLGTSVGKISDRMDLLLAKVESGVPRGSGSSPASDPEALTALAHGLVAHNERLRVDVEALQGKLTESQTCCTSLLTMNTELLAEKKEMLRREAELRKREEDDEEDNEEDSEDKEEPVKEEEEEENQSETEGDIHGLTPEEVRSLLKSTLSGLFRHLSSAFSEEEQYSRPQILQTVRSGLEKTYSAVLENLEEMAAEVEGTAAPLEEEEGGEKEQREEEDKEEEEENGESHPQVEVRSEKSSPGQE